MVVSEPRARHVPWAPGATGSMFQVLRRSDLVRRFGDELFRVPERLEFDMAVHCISGTGLHMVDFEEVDIAEGSVLHVRPGQIHQWRDDRQYDACLILVRQFRTPPRAHWPVHPEAVELSEAQSDRLALAYGLWQSLSDAGWADVAGPERSELATGAMRDVFQSVLGIPVDADVGSADRGHDAYFAFRDDLERHLDHRQSVQDRAGRLGYSTKTLDRACRAVVGSTAKRLADDRLALEARRMLALPDSRASVVARALGFDEATNFSKFMKRVTGQLPSDWQSG